MPTPISVPYPAYMPLPQASNYVFLNFEVASGLHSSAPAMDITLIGLLQTPEIEEPVIELWLNLWSIGAEAMTKLTQGAKEQPRSVLYHANPAFHDVWLTEEEEQRLQELLATPLPSTAVMPRDLPSISPEVLLRRLR